MIGPYKVVTLCGSTRFKDEFIKTQEEMALKGYIVLAPDLYSSTDKKYEAIMTPEIVNMFDDMHRKKIDMSDSIMVINKDDYIGKSTQSEIEYAKSKGKSVYYMFPHFGND